MIKTNKFFAICMVISIVSSLLAVPTLASTDSDTDYTIYDAYWDSGSEGAMARWEETDSNSSYRVQLYKSTTKEGSLKSTSSEHYNFTSLIVDEGTGTYYFTVYASKGGKSTLVTSDSYYIDYYDWKDLKDIDSDTSSDSSSSSSTSDSTSGPGVVGLATSASTGVTGWNQSSDGYWWYLDSNSNMAISSWKQINGLWYYFGSDGIMKTGWIQSSDNLWYYLGTDGAMLSNTTTPDGYYVGTSGAWVK